MGTTMRTNDVHVAIAEDDGPDAIAGLQYAPHAESGSLRGFLIEFLQDRQRLEGSPSSVEGSPVDKRMSAARSLFFISFKRCLHFRIGELCHYFLSTRAVSYVGDITVRH